jgi:hypothetical protein
MKYVIWMVLLGGGGALTYLWLNAEVPGGEKRYEQWVRLVQERHTSGI